MNNILADTNIFLEILLNQEKKEQCKLFLNENIDNLFISDFSLHSIGVILLRNKKEKIYEKFIKDILSKVSIVTLTKENYTEISKISKKYKMDFDDSYQTCVSLDRELQIVTMDKDFRKVEEISDIRFLN